MMKLISLIIPGFIAIVINYIKIFVENLFKKKKNRRRYYNLIENIVLYILCFIFINLGMIIAMRFKYGAMIWYLPFSISTVVKYIVLSSLLSLIMIFIYDVILKVAYKLNKEYKILNIKYSKSNLRKLIDDKNKFKSKSYNRKVIYFVLTFTFFMLVDIFTRAYCDSLVGFAFSYKLCAFLLTTMASLTLVAIIYLLPRVASKVFAIVSYVVYIFIFLVQYMLINIKSEAFSIYTLNDASEGMDYLNFILKEINLGLVVILVILITLAVFSYKYLSKIKKAPKSKIRPKKILILLVVIVALYAVAISSLDKYEPGEWEEITYPKYYYKNYVNPQKSLAVSGLYVYGIRDVYFYFKTYNKTYGSVEEIDEYIKEHELKKKDNEKTGVFKDKNLIMIMLESIDNVVVNEKTMPTLTKMKNEGWDFTERYSALSSGGSTIMTEYTSMTGLFYLNDNDNSKLSNTSYPISIPNKFSSVGYTTQSIHENRGAYYNRDELHRSFGLNNRYFIKDEKKKYRLYEDQAIMEEDDLYNFIVPKDDEKFMSFIITISAHGPYDETNYFCKQDNKKDKACLEYMSKRTDKMLEILLKRLEQDKLLDDTVIVLYTDHQAYSYSFTEKDKQNMKKVDDNYNIKTIPFVIYAKDIKHEKIETLVNDVDIVPTILNLFDIDYDPNHYIGTDLFSKDHKNVIMFTDYSWYDGKIYTGNSSVDKTTQYYKETSDYVKNKVDLSKKIISNNYFKNKTG